MQPTRFTKGPHCINSWSRDWNEYVWWISAATMCCECKKFRVFYISPTWLNRHVLGTHCLRVLKFWVCRRCISDCAGILRVRCLCLAYPGKATGQVGIKAFVIVVIRVWVSRDISSLFFLILWKNGIYHTRCRQDSLSMLNIGYTAAGPSLVEIDSRNPTVPFITYIGSSTITNTSSHDHAMQKRRLLKLEEIIVL